MRSGPEVSAANAPTSSPSAVSLLGYGLVTLAARDATSFT
jgi:hypothetical protein